MKMLGFKFPYTNFHELNLDWLISEMDSLDSKLNALENDMLKIYQFVKDNLKNYAIEYMNYLIQSGELNVAVQYTAVDERLDIIVTQ